MAKNRKALVIGLDGATFDLIGEWIKDGSLPSLHKIAEEGIAVPMETIWPAISSSAWCAMTSGKEPSKFGVYGFSVDENLDYDRKRHIVTSTDFKTDRVWDILNKNGKTCGVINIPGTYPPQKIKHFLISGWVGPRIESYPADLLKSVTYLDPITENKGDFYKEAEKVVRNRTEVALDLFKKYDPDFSMVVFIETEAAHHLFGVEMIEKDKKEEIKKFYSSVDACIKRFMEFAKETDRDVFIVSDHGVGNILKRKIHFNTWLKEMGYLYEREGIGISKLPKEQVYFKLRELGITKIMKKVMGESNFQKIKNPFVNVDWSKTVAFFPDSSPFKEGIQINLKGREPAGIVEMKDYDKIRDKIIQKLRGLRDPENGENVIDTIWKREELFKGPYADMMPDIVIRLKHGYDGRRSIEKEIFADLEKKEFTHTMEGIFMAYGPDIANKKGHKKVSILDVTPTILHLLGEAIPMDIDGKVLTSIFKEGTIPKTAPIKRVHSKNKERKSRKLSKDDEEIINGRLRSLGYI